MDVNICQETRLCKVGDEYGYFHTWEHYSKPLPQSPFVGVNLLVYSVRSLESSNSKMVFGE